MDDHPDPARSPILHIVAGLPLGLIGLIGSFYWYSHVSANSEDAAGAAPVLIGPVILGFFALLVTIWAVAGLVMVILDRNKD